MLGNLNLNFGEDIDFKIYKCSLCHILGKEYRIMARLFTNYDMALSLLLVSSCAREKARCKRNIFSLLSIKILGDELPILKYVAAIAVLLVSEKVKDDIYDEKKRYPERLLKWIKNQGDKTNGVMKDFKFNTGTIKEAFETQRMLEKEDDAKLLSLTEPTATVMSEIYAHATVIKSIPEYKNVFERISYSLGQIIYLLDCIADYKYDLMRGLFNPLHKCIPYRRDTAVSVVQNIKENVFYLLRNFQGNIKKALEELPEHTYLKDIFINRLPQKLEEIKGGCFLGKLNKLTFLEKIRNTLSLSFLSPSYAFAWNGEKSGGWCCESLTTYIFMIFIILLSYCIIYRGCVGRWCSSPSDRVTVDHGCKGKQTYKRDPCTGEYRDERNRCC